VIPAYIIEVECALNQGRTSMNRVTSRNPCPVCKKSDWCLYAEDFTAAICTRVSEGAVKHTNAGWLHILTDQFKPVKPPTVKKPVNINWQLLNQAYINNIHKAPINIYKICKDWNISAGVLDKMQVGLARDCITFPLKNADENIVGLQRRFPDNSKRLVKHSQAGLFIPQLNWDNLPERWCLFICEGASDTAVALDLGLRAIGRLSCGTGKDLIVKFCAKKKPSDIAIISDNDEPGIAGAKALGLWLAHLHFYFVLPAPNIKVIVPEEKDLRDWVKTKGEEYVKKSLTSWFKDGIIPG
jgi:hypothetical protein